VGDDDAATAMTIKSSIASRNDIPSLDFDIFFILDLSYTLRFWGNDI